jgi:4-amino-4-deoxy-L-arabinose transferase-like glycosyltransferase
MLKKYYSLFFALGIVLICFFSNLTIAGPVYQGDEGGYLANAATLSGNMLDAASSYFAGYSFFLAPSFWISNDPRVVFVFVKLINSIMWGISALLVIGIIRFTFPSIDQWKLMGAAMVALFYPAWITFSGYAFSENAFILFFLLSVYLAFRVAKTGKAWWIYWAVTLGYLFFIHPKSVPIIGAALLSSVLIAKARKDWHWLPVFFLIVISMALFYWYCIEPRLIKSMTIGDYPPSLHYPSPEELLTSVNSLERLRELVVRASGQLFYINLATLGLVFYPFFKIIIDFRSKIRKKSWEELIICGNRPVYIFLAISFLGTIVFSAINLEGGQRFDHWIYGRYLDGVTLPFLAMGFLLFSKRRAFLSIILLAITTMILFFFMPSKVGYPVNINGLGLWQTQLLGYSIGENAHFTILSWSISGLFLILITIMFKNYRYRVYFFILIYAFTSALQINYHEQLAKVYVYPKLEIRDYVSEKYPLGSCVALYGDGFETNDYFYVYAFYFQGYKFTRLNLSNWFKNCNGPLISTNTNINEDIPTARASIYNFADNAIVWDKINDEQKSNCLPHECINIINLKSFPYKQVGEKFSSGVRTNGKRGYLLFGPYVKMDVGEYILEIKGIRLESGGHMTIDVVGNGGEDVFASFDEVDPTSQQDYGILLRKRIVLDKIVNDLEVRVWVDGKAKVELYGYTLGRDK